jgi:hypothetical protein
MGKSCDVIAAATRSGGSLEIGEICGESLDITRDRHILIVHSAAIFSASFAQSFAIRNP